MNGASDDVQSKGSKFDNGGSNLAECVDSSCDTRLTFDDLLKNQSQVLHGEIQVDLNQIPKVRSYVGSIDKYLKCTDDKSSTIFERP